MSQTKKSILLALGRLIKHRRKAQKLSQEQLGFLSNLDRTYISGVERGIRNPSLTALVSLASGLDTTVSELLKDLETEVTNLNLNE
ncbi:Transcriptional Regulator, XRE family protein [Hyella patelloides LEGE 07179]|uniref:Transcriptional Regulator, XRE family protein n=1 Tax=Hyella patelloides LEGE 07179 TaxID=945734 RepID=A0A563VU93_9CYAN|nr:helix-turn-helix transcriptional regulator [Hyella patelloides]VEP15046.1 Transcriptional Regulator, XRE family protein [Hyella patelloides LEGE 07179]